jgi:hypothetical protein
MGHQEIGSFKGETWDMLLGRNMVLPEMFAPMHDGSG